MSRGVSDGWYAPIASRLANETDLKNSMLTHHYDTGMWIWVVLVPILYFWLHMVRDILIALLQYCKHTFQIHWENSITGSKSVPTSTSYFTYYTVLYLNDYVSNL